METINYKDSIIKVHHFKNFPMYLNLIESDEQVAIMVSNNEYIPNMSLHEVCYESFNNKENFIGNIEKDRLAIPLALADG